MFIMQIFLPVSISRKILFNILISFAIVCGSEQNPLFVLVLFPITKGVAMHYGIRIVAPLVVVAALIALLTFLNRTNAVETHETDNVVVACMDFRFQKRIHAWVTKTLKTADLVSLAGAAKTITDDDSRGLLLKQIGTSVEKHGASTVSIVNHVDCAAFGGSVKYPSPESEIAEHVKCLREAAKVIKQKFPDVNVKLYFMDWNSVQSIPLE